MKIKKFKCSRCKKSFDRKKVIKVSFNPNRNYHYYNCNSCNTKRARKYRNTDKGKSNIRRAVRNSIYRHMDRQLCRYKTIYLIRTGVIKRPKVCPVCKKRKRIEAHHTDYTKPRLVKFACRQCHALKHRRIKKTVDN